MRGPFIRGQKSGVTQVRRSAGAGRAGKQAWERTRLGVRACGATPTPGPGLTDERAQLVGQLPGAGGQHLPPHVLEDDGPGLQVHHEHGRELRLGPFQLHLRGHVAQSVGSRPSPSQSQTAWPAEGLTDVSWRRVFRLPRAE